MSVRFQDEAFPILKKYLYYLQTVRQKSVKTVDEYFIDLRTFFRYLKRARKLVPDDMDFEQIKIDDIGIELLESITFPGTLSTNLKPLKKRRLSPSISRSNKASNY